MANTKEKQQDKEQKKSETVLVMEWWAGLEKNKGGRVELRRAKTLDQVFFSPAFHALYRKLKPTGWYNKEKIALMAGVLAHVTTHAPTQQFAAQMASPGKSGSKAKVSGLRFRRLLQNKTEQDVYGPLIRIVRLLDKKTNVPDLAQSLYWWDKGTKQEWAFAYYEKAPGEE